VGSPRPNVQTMEIGLLLLKTASPGPGGKGAGLVWLEINIKEIINPAGRWLEEMTYLCDTHFLVPTWESFAHLAAQRDLWRSQSAISSPCGENWNLRFLKTCRVTLRRRVLREFWKQIWPEVVSATHESAKIGKAKNWWESREKLGWLRINYAWRRRPALFLAVHKKESRSGLDSSWLPLEAGDKFCEDSSYLRLLLTELQYSAPHAVQEQKRQDGAKQRIPEKTSSTWGDFVDKTKRQDGATATYPSKMGVSKRTNGGVWVLGFWGFGVEANETILWYF